KLLARSQKMVKNRAIHPDGRYYEFTSDLVRDRANFCNIQMILSGFDGASLQNDQLGFINAGPVEQGEKFRAIAERFRRMSNLITTRSDVFEILVTVQAGYGVDENNDGRINYRGREFVPVSEQSARMVYER